MTDTVTKCKKRIQKLLTSISRLRDNGCVFRDFIKESGYKCGGYTMAEHIVSRKFSNTYSDLDNIICLCYVHHIIFKPESPTVYTRIVKEYLGEGWVEEIEKKARKSCNFGLKDWQKEEERLKEVLAELST